MWTSKYLLLLLGFCTPFMLMAQQIQERCGMAAENAAIIAKHPEFAQHLEQRRQTLQAIANGYKQSHANSSQHDASAVCPAPVIFHFVLSSAQFTELGGTAGIQQRVDSQISVLNRDYNRENADSALIPSCWQPLYAKVGIRFAAASVDPYGHACSGYDLKITDTAFTNGDYGDYSAAKYDSSGGLNAWDQSQYINIWCIYFSDNTGLLGITSPISYTTAGGGVIPYAEMGICVAYNVVGKRASPSDSYPCGGSCTEYDEGRTVTHEMGHYFEIWHVWGDDGDLCPWNGGHDDGIADTPPQAGYTSGNPIYTIPCGTTWDACKYDGSVLEQPIGIGCLDYMDYTDDAGMHLFTPDQAAVMDSMVAPGGQSYAITQQCTLGGYTGVGQVAVARDLAIYPNPSKGQLSIIYNFKADRLISVSVWSVVGVDVLDFAANGADQGYISLDLSGLNKGIYLVKCNFANGTETRQILLQ